MIRWYVVHTLPRSEKLALENLLAQGFDAFLPRYHCVRRHARKVDVVLAPLFPRYLFVALDVENEHWLPVDSTRGVAYLVRLNGCPASMPLDVIQALKARSDVSDVVPLSCLEIFEKGAKLEVLDGAFAGQTGVYDKMSEGNRVRILLNLLGREVAVAVPVHSVVAV